MQPTVATPDFSDTDPDLPEVDTDELEDEADVPTDEPKGGSGVKTKKAAKTRPPVPDGYIAPVAFAKKLTEVLVSRGELDKDEEIPPQMIYSYIKNSQKGANPLTVYSAGGRDNLLKYDEALAWWDAKTERAKNRKAGAKKAKTATEDDAPAPTEEAE